MIIPTAGYTASAEGSRLKGVTCEHCGQQYAYLLVRSAAGYGPSPLGLDDDRAYRSAGSQAASVAAAALLLLANQPEAGIALLCLGIMVLARGAHLWYQRRMLNPYQPANGATAQSAGDRVSTREVLERMAAGDERVDIRDALLDWEGQKTGGGR